MKYAHTPVMLKEVMEILNPQLGQMFIDCTLGGGGYTLELARRVGERGKVLAIDLDETAIDNAKLQITNYKLQNIVLVHDNFKNLSKIIQKSFKDKTIKFDGVVFDLGLSSAQLEDRSRGFSFQLDAPLDMAFNQRTKNKEQRTEEIVNIYSENEIAQILYEYGEERYARRIAKGIVNSRKNKKIETTFGLVEIIRKAVPIQYIRNRKIHFATRTFQALRIATNDELNNLREVLPQAVALLKKGGRLAIISFHSLEDRIVKNFFKQESQDCLCPPEIFVCQCQHKASLKIISFQKDEGGKKKFAVPSKEEIANNPRARSAKMRAGEKK
ncbi:16S rRNA (cytosine(1402)-N(4))-methyltransferase RsmH [Patescibacteria group bacterium]|nr:16S rRNA (cytosine(1402)-N(4))-methyltransferase RsmH [Patescibacteria group bacterium]